MKLKFTLTGTFEVNETAEGYQRSMEESGYTSVPEFEQAMLDGNIEDLFDGIDPRVKDTKLTIEEYKDSAQQDVDTVPSGRVVSNTSDRSND